MHRGEEDYIKAMYTLESQVDTGEFVTNTALMQYFNHTAQSVHEMVKRLTIQGYSNYQPYKGSKLTEKGRTVACRMIRIHRLWEVLLVNTLGYTWDEVHVEAERLEHVTSRQLEERLCAFLGQSMYCPHDQRIEPMTKQSQKRVAVDYFEEKQ